MSDQESARLTEKRIGAIQGIYEWNQQLIYVADRKVSALLLINAVLISFSATWNLKEYAPMVKIIILAGIILAVVSTIMFLMAILPRVSKRAPESMLHYQGILNIPQDKYVSKMIDMDDEQLTKDYLETIYSLSVIQKKKNNYLASGCYFLIISICLLGLSFLVHNR